MRRGELRSGWAFDRREQSAIRDEPVGRSGLQPRFGPGSIEQRQEAIKIVSVVRAGQLLHATLTTAGDAPMPGNLVQMGLTESREIVHKDHSSYSTVEHTENRRR